MSFFLQGFPDTNMRSIVLPHKIAQADATALALQPYIEQEAARLAQQQHSLLMTEQTTEADHITTRCFFCAHQELTATEVALPQRQDSPDGCLRVVWHEAA